MGEPLPRKLVNCGGPEQAQVRLSKAQLDCLMLVGEHLTSKEIGARLGISRHTVDQRIRRALRILGYPTRREAARVLKSGTVWPQPLTLSRAQTAELHAAFLPFATHARSRNQMSLRARLIWICLIGLFFLLSPAAYIAAYGSLAPLFH